MLQAIDVSKTYKDNTKAVDKISFEFKEHNSYSIIGPSGCGKSTFLLMAAGLLKPTSGKFLIKGKELKKPYDKSATILQNFGLLPWYTVYENVALGLKIKGFKKREIEKAVNETLKAIGLYEFKDFYPSQLSGGMRQKVAFGRAFALKPEIVFLDEPLSSLDALNREKMQNFLVNLWKKEKVLMIVITHSIEEAVFLGKEILVFSNRPARLVKVIKNESAGETNYRNTTAFLEKCKLIREYIKL
ncbi:ABC transporter ATP-binding protein [Hippea alviniae]|uniref:ABC transporter ATP-binding protein n=1 Tax=Hippea alviniae TaxID=1279027 RepID=UPI0003B46D18|nr:ABC transporter ATP-binding protein [Hippea alviniae]